MARTAALNCSKAPSGGCPTAAPRHRSHASVPVAGRQDGAITGDQAHLLHLADAQGDGVLDRPTLRASSVTGCGHWRPAHAGSFDSCCPVPRPWSKTPDVFAMIGYQFGTLWSHGPWLSRYQGRQSAGDSHARHALAAPLILMPSSSPKAFSGQPRGRGALTPARARGDHRPRRRSGAPHPRRPQAHADGALPVRNTAFPRARASP